MNNYKINIKHRNKINFKHNNNNKKHILDAKNICFDDFDFFTHREINKNKYLILYNKYKERNKYCLKILNAVKNSERIKVISTHDYSSYKFTISFKVNMYNTFIPFNSSYTNKYIIIKKWYKRFNSSFYTILKKSWYHFDGYEMLSINQIIKEYNKINKKLEDIDYINNVDDLYS